MFLLYNFNKSNIIKIMIKKYQYMHIKLTMHILLCFFAVKCKLFSGLGKA